MTGFSSLKWGNSYYFNDIFAVLDCVILLERPVELKGKGIQSQWEEDDLGQVAS